MMTQKKKIKGPVVGSDAHSFLLFLIEGGGNNVERCIDKFGWISELRAMYKLGLVEVSIAPSTLTQQYLDQLDNGKKDTETVCQYLNDSDFWSKMLSMPRKITKIDNKCGDYSLNLTYQINEKCSIRLKMSYKFDTKIRDDALDICADTYPGAFGSISLALNCGPENIVTKPKMSVNLKNDYKHINHMLALALKHHRSSYSYTNMAIMRGSLDVALDKFFNDTNWRNEKYHIALPKEAIKEFHMRNWEALIKHASKKKEVKREHCALLLAHDSIAVRSIARMLLLNKFGEE